MTALGFMHAPKLSIMHNPQFVLAYVIVAITLVIFNYMGDKEKDLEAEHKQAIVD